ncbi:SPOR domain-containing protein [Enterovibrio calviensis]|uniref:SPOR domain-containing protein n=1 Tax=Enterovibrio calviensis TaxID=91359 RepID=UPI0004842A70|nr:SPOR domain-containing protein [Enterovibrio calviensis]
MRPSYYHFLGVLFTLLLSSNAVQSAETDCSSSIQNDWNVVKQSCPIGKGLWGRTPENTSGAFWVQCGLINKLPEPSFVKMLPDSIDKEAIVFRQEGNQYRCLVGPFDKYANALTARDALRQKPAFSGAFIRDAMLPDTAVPVQMHTSSTQKTKPEPVIALKRDYFEIANTKSPKPTSDERSFKNGDYVWWRATLQEATLACENDRMKLVSLSTLRAIAENPEKKALLPTRLPFWVAEQHAFDSTMMVPMPLSEESSLLVLCE